MSRAAPRGDTDGLRGREDDPTGESGVPGRSLDGGRALDGGTSVAGDSGGDDSREGGPLDSDGIVGGGFGSGAAGDASVESGTGAAGEAPGELGGPVGDAACGTPVRGNSPRLVHDITTATLAMTSAAAATVNVSRILARSRTRCRRTISMNVRDSAAMVVASPERDDPPVVSSSAGGDS
jgi:hypothetical protein